MKRLQKKNGFSLIESTLMIAVLAIVAMIVKRMVDDWAKQKVQNEFYHKMNSFGLDMARTVSKPLNCRETIPKGVNLSSDPFVTKIRGRAATGNLVDYFVTGNKYSQNEIELISIQIRNYTEFNVGNKDVAAFNWVFKYKYLNPTKMHLPANDPAMTLTFIRGGTVVVDADTNMAQVFPTPPKPVTVDLDRNGLLNDADRTLDCVAGAGGDFVELGGWSQAGDQMTGPLFMADPSPPKLPITVIPDFPKSMEDAGFSGSTFNPAPYRGKLPAISDNNTDQDGVLNNPDQDKPAWFPDYSVIGARADYDEIGPGRDPPRILVKNGYITAAFFVELSDRRMKANVRSLADPLSLSRRLSGVEFQWNIDGKDDFGFIAQEVETKFPMLVSRDASDDRRSVRYTGMIPIQVESVKQLHSEQMALKNELKLLRQQLQAPQVR